MFKKKKTVSHTFKKKTKSGMANSGNTARKASILPFPWHLSHQHSGTFSLCVAAETSARELQPSKILWENMSLPESPRSFPWAECEGNAFPLLSWPPEKTTNEWVETSA